MNKEECYIVFGEDTHLECLTNHKNTEDCDLIKRECNLVAGDVPE